MLLKHVRYNNKTNTYQPNSELVVKFIFKLIIKSGFTHHYFNVLLIVALTLLN